MMRKARRPSGHHQGGAQWRQTYYWTISQMRSFGRSGSSASALQRIVITDRRATVLRPSQPQETLDSFSESVVGEFLESIERKYKTGAICRSKRGHLRRISLLLRDYVANKTIEWKSYVFKHSPMPTSQEFLLLHSRFIANLRFSAKSGNTIQSGRNSVRQFLLFLEDSGVTQSPPGC